MKRAILFIHLCLTLGFFLWLIFSPHFKDVALREAEGLLYERFVGHPSFETLPKEEQWHINQHLARLMGSPSPAFVLCFPFHAAPFGWVWIILSFILCSFLIFSRRRIERLLWLLPFLAVCHGLDLYAKSNRLQTRSIFPSRSYIAKNYQEKRSCFLQAWHRYLVAEWAQETPSRDNEIFKQQVEKALFALNRHRIEALKNNQEKEILLAGLNQGCPLFKLLIFFLWNIFFAWTMKPFAAASIPA